MSRVPRPASQPEEPARSSFPIYTTIGVMALLMVIAVSLLQNRRGATPVPEPAAVADTESAQPAVTDAASQPATTARTAALPRSTSAVADGQTDSRPVHVGQGSPGAELLINQLTQLQIAGGKLTAQQGQQIQQTLRQIVAQGPVALPAIRALLGQNVDLPFGQDGTKLAGTSSLRAGLIESLGQIGGPEALALSRQVLQNTADPVEISLLARNLEEAAPGQYRQEALDAARQALTQAAAGNLDLKDVGPLFKVIQTYGDSTMAPDLVNAGTKWGSYASMALAGLQSGEGIPSLVKLTQDPDQNRIAVQMLAQLSGQYPDAGSALVEMARQNQIPDRLWSKIVEGLAGDQYQIGSPAPAVPGQNQPPLSGLKTYHLVDGNQNFYSLPLGDNGSVPDVSQRLAIVDQLLQAAAGNPAANAALNRARASLTGK